MSAVPAATIGSRRLDKGVTATWWYTASGVIIFQLTVAFVWVTVMFGMGTDAGLLAIATVGGLIWCVSSVPLLMQYRHRDDAAGPAAEWRGILIPLVLSLAFGIFCGFISGLWVAGVLPIVQTMMLLNWPRGVRLRLVIASVIATAALWFIDWRLAAGGGTLADHRTWWVFGFFAISLPVMTVLSLWWWDVLVTLDRARAAEARLGATQERLRVATDVHDLQGHHLQVIALQLELAERLLTKDDADAALEQLRLARTSVADARQGTRDLAMRFRGVPLHDEIANAVDLLRAAGTSADAVVSAEAAEAPASVLGPVIRETTTNVLRHGAGRRARLSLQREGAGWRYEIANDATGDDERGDGRGSGLEGITRRVAEAGGTVRVEQSKGEFQVIVTVPDEPGGPDGQTGAEASR